MKYTVAVKTLCEFTAKRGNLDARFTPSPSAMEGIVGHRVIASRRAANYEKELTLEGEYGSLQIRGRADGYDPTQKLLEEFKTYRGDLARMRDNHRALHWAQLRIYGWLLCKLRGLTNLRLALVYFDVTSERETALEETRTAEWLQEHFETHCQQFVSWAESETVHRTLRDEAMQSLRFPFPDFHAGQRQLAERVYRRAQAGGVLLAQAPTGIGKTMGTLFPALKALSVARLDKVFYLVAKTSGRRLALDALRRLLQVDRPGPSLRVVEMVAREKVCEYPDLPCDGAVCPLARGFYDRLPAAREEAMAAGFLDRDNVRRIALRHQVCPYYLSQELARWSDVVVGDYNYYFDRSGMLFGWTVSHEWKVCLLVDEAHNLIERARSMYSTSLEEATFRGVLRHAPEVVARALRGVAGAWRDLVSGQDDSHRVYEALPPELVAALERAVAAVGEYLGAAEGGLGVGVSAVANAGADADGRAGADAHVHVGAGTNGRAGFDANGRVGAGTTGHAGIDANGRVGVGANSGTEPRTSESLLEFYFNLLGFCRLAADFDASSMFEITLGARGSSVLRLRNLIPGRFLAARFAAAKVSVLFSATLTPGAFFRDILGLPRTAEYLDVDSPFKAEQLAVRLVNSVSTRFRDRERSVAPIAEILGSQYSSRPGNYLAFVSSFEYLNRIAARFAWCYPTIPFWKQHAGMTEPERDAFLARFVPDGSGVGFAVLGGAFAEAVDLPGSRLIGAFIATLGLPQVNPVNAEMERRMQSMFGSGYEYTYLYPGLQKVVQAAGRVIRAQADRGVLYLIDDRFADARVRELLPRWWRIDSDYRRLPGGSGVALGEAVFDMTRQLGGNVADAM